MDFKYKHNQEHLYLLLDQVWEAKEEHGGDLTVYDGLAPYEVSQIKEFLPEDPKVIWEMGAGLGRGSIYLNYWYGAKKSRRWYLFDRNGFSERNTGAFNPKEDEYYNDFMLGASSPDVTMIFGTRHAGYNDKSFSDKFKEVIFLPSKGKAPFPIENWLILRGLK